MNAHDDAERFADSRPGMDLVDYVEVGLPCWRVLARCAVLARKPISAFDETILDAVRLGVTEADDLDFMLGLGEATLEPAIASLVSRQWLDSADGHLRLAPAGTEALNDAAEIVSREVVVPFDYDGLLRQPLAHETVVNRAAARDRGLRNVPGYPEDPPDVAELQAARPLIVRQLRATSVRHQDSELLAVNGIDRRDARVLPATALLFAPRTRGACEVALIVDGEASADRTVALSNAGHVTRLGLGRELRAANLRPLAPFGPPHLRPGLQADVEAQLRRTLTQALRDADEARGDETDVTAAVKHAREALGAHSPRTVTPNEHHTFVDFSAGASARRLLIDGGRLTRLGVSERLLRRLREIADRRVPIRIAHDGPADGHGDALARLTRLARDYPSVIVERRADPDAPHRLICDDRWLIAGQFDWLGHLGDPQRPLADRRSVLTAQAEKIDAAWAETDGRPPPAPPATPSGQKPPTRQRGGRRRRGKPST